MQEMDPNPQKSDKLSPAVHRYRVGVLPIPGFALMSYACTVEPPRAANLSSWQPLYDVVHFGAAEMVPSSGAAAVELRRPVGDMIDLDLMLNVAGGGPFAFCDAAAPQRGGVVERLGAPSPHILEAVTAMERHIGDPLTLDQFALMGQVSTRHLNRLFGDATGQSVMDFYLDVRLNVAKRLIHSTAMAMGEIAEATGFSNAGHFSNACKARFCVRPRSDRKASRAGQGPVWPKKPGRAVYSDVLSVRSPSVRSDLRPRNLTAPRSMTVKASPRS